MNMLDNGRVERRKEHREMHLDRRKSDIDVIEHVACGLRRTDLLDAMDDDDRRVTPPSERT